MRVRKNRSLVSINCIHRGIKSIPEKFQTVISIISVVTKTFVWVSSGTRAKFRRIFLETALFQLGAFIQLAHFSTDSLEY